MKNNKWYDNRALHFENFSSLFNVIEKQSVSVVKHFWFGTKMCWKRVKMWFFVSGILCWKCDTNFFVLWHRYNFSVMNFLSRSFLTFCNAKKRPYLTRTFVESTNIIWFLEWWICLRMFLFHAVCRGVYSTYLVFIILGKFDVTCESWFVHSIFKLKITMK